MTACQFVLKINCFYDNTKMKKLMAQRLTIN